MLSPVNERTNLWSTACS